MKNKWMIIPSILTAVTIGIGADLQAKQASVTGPKYLKKRKLLTHIQSGFGFYFFDNLTNR